MLKLAKIERKKEGNKMPRKITLTQKRKAELKRKYHGGEAVGKAVLKYFLEEISAGDNPNYEFTLNGEELKFIENELGEYGTQRDLFVQYYMYTRIIVAQYQWILFYKHRLYHGFFKILMALKSANSDIEKLTLILQLNPEERNKKLKDFKEEYLRDLKFVAKVLQNTWHTHMVLSLKCLYLYKIMLTEIKKGWNLDIDAIMPDMEHHEKEVLNLQDIAKNLIKNIELNQQNFDMEIPPEVLDSLHNFCNITPGDFYPNKEAVDFHVSRTLDLMNSRLDIILNTSFNLDPNARNI